MQCPVISIKDTGINGALLEPFMVLDMIVNCLSFDLKTFNILIKNKISRGRDRIALEVCLLESSDWLFKNSITIEASKAIERFLYFLRLIACKTFKI